MEHTLAVDFRFIQFVVMCKHGLEKVGQFVVNESMPQLQALHIKYVFDLQHFQIFELRISMSNILPVRHTSQGTFCNVIILSYSKPQHVFLNCKWESKSESYINFIADRGTYLLDRFIVPNGLFPVLYSPASDFKKYSLNWSPVFCDPGMAFLNRWNKLGIHILISFN